MADLKISGTGMSGGVANECVIVGVQNVHVQDNRNLDDLRERTSESISRFIKGMVETVSLGIVMDRINHGTSWITLTGCPGEGKTILGFMILNKLRCQERKVFYVETPNDFIEIRRSCVRPVILMDDMFGQTEFNRSEWSQWEAPLSRSARDIERTSPARAKIENLPTIIFIGRDFVFRAASRYMGNVSEFVTNQRYVFNLSSAVRDFHEKIEIWKANSEELGIYLDGCTVLAICDTETPHGFPYVCRLFAMMRDIDENIDVEDFFKRPLEFLNKTLKTLIMNKAKETVFVTLVQHDGRTLEITLCQCGSDVIRAANDMHGTYIKKEWEYYLFDHPSIFDCVAYLLCETQLELVITHCTLYFISQRLQLQTPICNLQYGNTRTWRLVYHIPWNSAELLAKRFSMEIRQGNIKMVMAHRACQCEEFVRLTLTHLSSFYVMDSDEKSLLHYLCELGHPSCVDSVLNIYNDVNVLDVTGWSPLSYACMNNHTGVIDLLLTKGATVTPLIVCEACRKGTLTLVESFFDIGATMDMEYSRYTPLFSACKGGDPEVISFLVSKGANMHQAGGFDMWSPLHEACQHNNPQAVEELIRHGADKFSTHTKKFKDYQLLARADDAIILQDGDTPIHTAVRWRSNKCVEVFMKHGVEVVNLRNAYGHTPLHISVCNKMGRLYAPHVSVVKLLLDHGADVSAEDDDGNTALHLLCCTDKNSKVFSGGCVHTIASELAEDYREIVTMLLDHGADRHRSNKDGVVALRGWCSSLIS